MRRGRNWRSSSLCILRTCIYIQKEMFIMTEREKMLAGQLYDCGDKELFPVL